MTTSKKSQKLTKRRRQNILRFILVLLLFLVASSPLVFGIATLGIQSDSEPWLPYPVAYQGSADYSVDAGVEARPRIREEVIEDAEKDALVATAPPPTIVVVESPTPTPSPTPSATPLPANLVVNAGGPYQGEEGRLIPVQATVEELIGLVPGSITYRWDMDNDGQYDDQQGASVTALFVDEGKYVIGVEAADFLGRVATDTTTVSVINLPPIVRIGEDQIADEAEEIFFEASADDPGQDILTYEWDFGDGTVAILDTLSPRHTYADNGNYTVRLRVADNDDGVSEDTLFVQVLNLPPLVEAGPDQTVSEGGTITLSGVATDPAKDFDPLAYAWDLDYQDDAFKADVFGPVVSSFYPDGPKTQVAALRVKDDDGGQTIDTLTVQVQNQNPSITNITNTGPVGENLPLTLNVTATDVGSDTLTYNYDWENDGLFDALNQPATISHAWPDNGNYIVGVLVNDGDGGQVFATNAISVYNRAPTAIANQLAPDFEGKELAFNATASTDPSPVDTLTYQWDFGDGSPTATGLDASHIYQDNGSYKATLTVKDDDGGSDTIDVPVTIWNANPVADAGGNRAINEDEILTLSGSATDPGSLDGPFTYIWDLDNDGTFETSGQVVNKTPLDGPATLNVALRVQDKDYPYPTANGGEIGQSASDIIQITVNNVPPTNINAQGPYNSLEGQPVTLTAGDATDVASDPLTYDWDVNNNGVFTTGQTITHTWWTGGVYPITLRVSDGDGGEAFDTTTITINNGPPLAVAGGPYVGAEDNPGSPTSPLSPIIFDASGTTDPSPADLLTFTWDFGDGTPQVITTSLTAPHTYRQDGSYIAMLIVDDGNGGSDTDTATVTINNRPPIAVAQANPTTISEGNSVTFNSSGSSDPGPLDSLTFTWDFGDGAPPVITTSLTVAHTYRQDGNYIATLTVDDSNGGISTDTVMITVNNLPPTAVAQADPTNIPEGNSVTFNGSSSTDPGPVDTLTYQWNFDDGSPSATGSIVNHIYRDDGIYNPSLTVIDNAGASDTAGLVITVTNVAPTAVMTTGPLPALEGEPLLFGSGLSSDPGPDDILTYQWDFGDGSSITTTTNVTITHIYRDDGIYNPSLTVIDNAGASDTAGLVITVTNVAPTAVMTTGPLPALEGEPLLFGSGLSSDPGPDDILTYQWDFGDGSSITTTTNVTITHTFPDGDQVYTITLTVDDGDGGSDTIITTAPISNADPIVNAGGPYATSVGLAIPLTASGTDVPSDTLTYAWDLNGDSLFDDGTGQTITFTDVATPNLFTVSVQVTDEDGGVGTDTTTVTVNNVLPIALLGSIPYLIRRRRKKKVG